MTPGSHDTLLRSPEAFSHPYGSPQQWSIAQEFHQPDHPWDRFHRPRGRGILLRATGPSSAGSLLPTLPLTGRYFPWKEVPPRPKAIRTPAGSLQGRARAYTASGSALADRASTAHICPQSLTRTLPVIVASVRLPGRSYRSKIGGPNSRYGTLSVPHGHDDRASCGLPNHPVRLREPAAALPGHEPGPVHRRRSGNRLPWARRPQTFFACFLQVMVFSGILPLAYLLLGFCMIGLGTPRYGCAALFSTRSTPGQSLHTFSI